MWETFIMKIPKNWPKEVLGILVGFRAVLIKLNIQI